VTEAFGFHTQSARFEVLLDLACDPTTPAETLIALTQPVQHSAVLICLSQNPNAPATALEHLLTCPSPFAARAAAAHRNLPLNTLLALIPDQYKDWTLLTPPNDSNIGNLTLGAAANLTLPLHILKRFTLARSHELRRATAANPNTAPEDLHHAATTGGTLIRQAVAGNPNLPHHTAVHLATDPDPTTRRLIAHHVNIPDEVRTLAALAGGTQPRYLTP
jgi:hypothetical protein